MTVYMFLADGFEEIEALCTLDLLRRAGVSVTTVGVSGKEAMGSHSICVKCDITENELDTDGNFDMVILPGGMPGSVNLDNSSVVDKMVKRAYDEDKFICAICAAPFILVPDESCSSKRKRSKLDCSCEASGIGYIMGFTHFITCTLTQTVHEMPSGIISVKSEIVSEVDDPAFRLDVMSVHELSRYSMSETKENYVRVVQLCAKA